MVSGLLNLPSSWPFMNNHNHSCYSLIAKVREYPHERLNEMNAPATAAATATATTAPATATATTSTATASNSTASVSSASRRRQLPELRCGDYEIGSLSALR